MPPLIVLDTGVVIRALIGSTGASSYRMVRLAATGTVRLAHSDEGLRELTRVVEEKDEEGFIRSASKAFGIAMDLWAHGTLYHPTRRDWPSLDDPDDGWMLDLAFDAEADYIVSWDPHLTYPPMPFPIEVLSPSVFLFNLEHGGHIYFVLMHLYPPIQHIEAPVQRGRPLERLLAALGGVLCVILHLNFGEYPFYEVG